MKAAKPAVDLKLTFLFFLSQIDLVGMAGPVEPSLTLDIDEKRREMLVNPGDVKQIFCDLKMNGFAPLFLTGHESTLFCKHMSFGEAHRDMENPWMKPSEPLSEFVIIDYDAELASFSAMLSSLSRALFGVKPGTKAEPGDVEVLQTTLECFMSYPVLSYKEVYLENATTNNLVGGKIDILVGSSSNGNKPKLRVTEHSRNSDVRNVYIGTLGEAKTTDINLPLASSSSSFDRDVKQNKTLIQPMLQVMAVSEVCDCNSLIPVINIFEIDRVLDHCYTFKTMMSCSQPPCHLLTCLTTNSIVWKG